MNVRSGMLVLLIAAGMLGLVGCGREEAQKAKKELDDAKTQLAKLQDEVKSTRKSFDDLQKKYTSMTGDLETARNATLQARSKRKASERKMDQMKDDLEEKLSAAEKQIETLKKEITGLQKAQSVSETTRKSAENVAAKYRRENIQLRKDLQILQEEVRQLRGIKPSPKDKPGSAASVNLPRMPASAPTETLPDPTK